MRRAVELALGALVWVAAACAEEGSGTAGTVEMNDLLSVTVRPVLSCAAEGAATGDPYDPAAMAVIVTPGADGSSEACNVGPTAVTGTAFAGDAVAEDSDYGWVVNVSVREGAAGLDLLNVVAAQCFRQAAACPTGQLAVVIDGYVVMKATVMSAEFGPSLQIAGDYDEQQARAIAELLNAAA